MLFPLTSLLRTHQGVLAFTLWKIRWWSFRLVFGAVHLWSNCPRCIFKPSILYTVQGQGDFTDKATLNSHNILTQHCAWCSPQFTHLRERRLLSSSAETSKSSKCHKKRSNKTHARIFSGSAICCSVLHWMHMQLPQMSLCSSAEATMIIDSVTRSQTACLLVVINVYSTFGTWIKEIHKPLSSHTQPLRLHGSIYIISKSYLNRCFPKVL